MVVLSETAIVETTSYINDERFDNDPDFHHCRLNLFFRVELEWEYETFWYWVVRSLLTLILWV